MKNFSKNILPYIFILFSTFVGIRIVNVFLMIDDRPKGISKDSTRKYPELKKTLNVIHEEDYDINSKSGKTVIIVADSFGRGTKCGNMKNIAGCMTKYGGFHTVNLSESGKGPATYLRKLSDYIFIQRSINPDNSGERIHFILYSNDVALNEGMCDFIRERNLDSNTYSQQEKENLRDSCNKKFPENLAINHKLGMSNITKIKKILRIVFGTYSFNLFYETVMQLQIRFNLIENIGRISYINNWKISSPERRVVADIIVEAYQYCKKNNCNIIFSTFPNVENINKNSTVYRGYLSFIDYMNLNHSIQINDGYTPFFEKGIKNASYSLTDVHSNCNGYKIYSDWLIKLNK